MVLVNSASTNFEQQKSGVGKQLETKTRIFPCVTTIPGASKTSVFVPSDGDPPYVNAYIYDGPDQDQAESTYVDYANKVHVAFPDWQFKDHQWKAGGKARTFRDAASRAEIAVSISRASTGGSTHVSLSVSSLPEKDEAESSD
jgi:hypothetical protein